MSEKLLKENGIKFKTKSPKFSKNKQDQSKIKVKEYKRNLSPSSSKLYSRKSSTKNINNNYKSQKNFHFNKKKPRESASPIYYNSIQKNFNGENNSEKIEQVDKIFLGKKKLWNSSSRLTSSQYIPLSIKSKMESFKDIDKLSVERFKKYNSIFEKIKEQIYDINQVCKSIGVTTEANSSMDFQNSTLKNVNNTKLNNHILNISNDFNDLEKQIKKQEKKESKLIEEKEEFDNNINIYHNFEGNKNNNLYHSLKTEQTNILYNKNKNDYINNTSLSKCNKFQNQRIILLKKIPSLKLIHEFDNQIYANKIKFNKKEDKNNDKLFKQFLEKRNIENISFINNRSKLNNQINLKANNKYLKISNSTNLFYEGESYCKCEKCLIF